VGKELLKEILKYLAIYRALEYACEKDPVLRIGRQNLVSLAPVKLGDMDRRYA
jgi:hypothetical protein